MQSPAVLTTPKPSPNSTGRDPLLLPRLDETRRAVARTRGFILASVIVAALLALFGLSAVVDYFLVMPYLVRVVCFTTIVLICSIAFWQIHRQWIAPLSPHWVAADIERHQPTLGQRLRTVADYEDPDAAPILAHGFLVSALKRQTQHVATNKDFEELPSKEPLKLAVAALGGVVALCLMGLLGGREHRLAAGRAMLMPWHYTTVMFSPQTTVIKTEERVTVKAAVKGRPLADAALLYRSRSSAKWSRIPMKPVAGADQELLSKAHHAFSTTLPVINENFVFKVDAGPRELPLGSVTVLQPLTFKRAMAVVTPPEYLGLPSETRELKELELKVFEGSNIDLTFETNRSPAEVVLIAPSAATITKTHVHAHDAYDLTHSGAASRLPMHVQGNSARIRLTDVRRSGTYRISAKARDGIALEPREFKLSVIPDHRPQVEFVRPPEQLEVTPTTEVAITMQAEDDRGLHKVGIMYQVGDGPLETLYEEDAGGSSEPRLLSRTLMLEDHALTYQDQISYYAFAEDNYLGRPRRSTTPLRFIDIRPYKREFRLAEGGGSCKGTSLTLEELIARQRHNLSLTFTAAELKNPDGPTQQRLLTNERELAAATSEFATGLALRGHTSLVLEAAIDAMESAVAHLEKPEFDSAVQSQQSAVTALVRARKNLRQLLSNTSSSSSSACRTFDRQQRQRLRTPVASKQDEQQQTQQQRQQLNDLAQRQRQWSEEVRSGQKQKEGQQGREQESEQLAEQQQQMTGEMQRLAQQLASTLQQRAEQVADQMKNSAEALRQQRSEAAEQQALETAEQLEQLADHLAAMNSQDFLDQLTQAQRTAQQLAQSEEQVRQQLQSQTQNSEGASQLAAEQRGYATQATLLSELLARLRSQAFEHGPTAQQSLDQLQESRLPAEIAEQMRQAANKIEAGEHSQAAEQVDEAAQKLGTMAEQLGELRRNIAQPRLDELVALEQQIARLVEHLASQNESQLDAAQQQFESLQPRLEALADGDPRLAEALQKAQQNPASRSESPESPDKDDQATGTSHSAGNDQEVAPGHYDRDALISSSGLRQVNGVLQTKIQEMILGGVLMDADDAVPPEYKELVEQYYRELSDDLRP